MQSGMRTVAGSVRGRRTHNTLIAGQIALTLLLLAGASAAMEGFVRLLHAPLGYDPHNVISIWVPFHENSYTTWASRLAYFEQLQAKLADVPGVTMTATATNATPPQAGSNMPVEIAGRPALGQQTALVNLVDPKFFPTLRIAMERGRIWSDTENHNGAHLAVINQAMASRYFSQGDAVGHSIKLSGLENQPPVLLAAPGIADAWLQIVGVVGDSRNDGLRNPVRPAVFVPYTLYMPAATQILVRSEVPPLTLLHSIRLALATLNPNQQAARVVSDLDHWISDQPEWQQEHLVAWLFSMFALLALILAAVGLYSVTSYSVAQRTNEFGIRMALGAQRSHVLRIVFSSIVLSVATGVLAGMTLVFALHKILLSWIGNNWHDPIMLLSGVALLSLVAVIACYIPARRASHVDPMTALRCE